VIGSQGGALEGIRVVDLTRALAGPYCTLMLADHGADVVKIEMPGTGDETREWAPPSIKGVSAYYLAINRNKRSVTCDLKHPDGKRVLERLLERADVDQPLVFDAAPTLRGEWRLLHGRSVAT